MVGLAPPQSSGGPDGDQSTETPRWKHDHRTHHRRRVLDDDRHRCHHRDDGAPMTSLPPPAPLARPIGAPPVVPPFTAPPEPIPERPWWRRWYGPLFSARTWTETLHLLLDLPLGIATFVVAVVLLSLSLGLMITLLGLPLLVFTIWVGRAIGVIERGRVRWLLGVPLPAFPPVPTGGGLWRQTKRRLGDGAGWRGLAYAPVALGWGIVSFVVTVVVWSVALAAATAPIYLPWGGADFGGSVNWVGATAIVVGYAIVGWLLLAAAPRITHALASASRSLIGAMLSPGRAAVLEARVETLQESRDASVEGSALELRRIERDLHDGAQQRLVGLAMDLGLARERLANGGDPARAAELVERAHNEAKLAITELRDLVRGIHPAVLTDRGLDPALSAVAARCPIPVDVQVDLPDRPPPTIEAAAYFVVSEALTNVAKHSRARHAWVDVSRREDGLVVSVRDDGVGGAQVQPDGGLAGLRDRVTAVEGRFRLASPTDGPTTLLVELPYAAERPCES